MKGVDRDLAAHFTVICHRGKCLYGKGIQDVFGKVDRQYYLDSILSDIEDAEKDIMENPVYIVLNLCRVLACKREGTILSKKEGGEWGLKALPGSFTESFEDRAGRRFIIATYVISDIHGEYEMFLELLGEIGLRAEDTLYILGDVLDRGPHPIRTLLMLMKMPNVVCLAGNHELMALECLGFLMKEITDMSIGELDEKTLAV